MRRLRVHQRRARVLRERGAITIAAVLLAAGVAAGGVGAGVALERSGVFGGGDETATVSLDAVSTFDCPDGAAVGELHRGDRVLATGRDASDDWVEIRDPYDLPARVWVAARHLVPDRDLAGLDERECSTGDERSPIPSATSDAPAPDVTTTTRTAAVPAPAPTDVTGPAIGAVGAQPALIFTSGGACTNTTSIVTVGVSDPSGVQSVAVSWVVPGGASGTGTPEGGGFRVGPQPFSPNLPANTPVTLTITARDGAGNQSQAANTTALKVSPCP